MKVKLPRLFEASLSNGLKLLIVKKSDLPLITIEIMMRAGAADDPADLAGLCDITGELLTRGSTELTADELDSELDRSGMVLSPIATYDASFLTITGLAEDCHRMLDIMNDLLQRPLFPEEELTDLKKRRLAQLAERENNPTIIASDTMREVLYKDHPYGYALEGTRDSITRIEIDDIRNFYTNNMSPNRSTLLVIGDIHNEKKIIRDCEERFANWPSGPSRTGMLPTPCRTSGINVWLVDKPELTQAQIRFGHLGIKRKTEDFFSIQMMNYILGGGGFASRLMARIRSEKGYTYGISSSFNPRLEVGTFMISTFTANEKVTDMIIDVYDTINRFIKEGASDSELEEAKQFYCGNYPLQFDTLGKISGKLLSVELYDLGKDYIETYTENIAKVNLKAIHEAVQKYVHPEDFHIVIVGKSAAYRDSLSSLEGFHVFEKET
ncbi:MAG: M16 family metallopeptidase [bacterium]